MLHGVLFVALFSAAVAYMRLRQGKRPNPHKFRARTSPPEEEPLGAPTFRFGVIGDVQYADADDAMDYDKTHTRHYRGTLDSVRAGVAAWNAGGALFAVQMGDVIDGRCARGGKGASVAALTTVRTEFSKFTGPVYDVIGNHELYNFTRAEMLERGMFKPVLNVLSTIDGGRLTPACAATVRMYYDFSPCPGWRVIVLDTYDQTTIGDPSLKSIARAYALLDEYNPNDTRAAGDWFAGLRGLPRRFVPYNGGVGHAQLAWFRSTLRRAVASGEMCIVFAHVPVCVNACRSKRTLLWNYQDVLDAMHTDGRGHVVAYIAGHAHQGGYNIDDAGVHHRTIESPLEAATGTTAYGVMDVHDGVCGECGTRTATLALKCVTWPPLLVMKAPHTCVAH